MIPLRAGGTFFSAIGAVFFLLYLWTSYFSLSLPSPVFGILALIAGGVGAYALVGDLLPRRLRTPPRLLRWNALLATLGLAHTLIWGLLSLLVPPDNHERLSNLVRGILETGLGLQAIGHALITAYLVLARPRPEKKGVVIGFFALAILTLWFRHFNSFLSPYLTLLLWASILPLLYFSQWLEDIASRQMSESLLLIGASAAGLFIGWQVLPSVFLPTQPPLYAAMYPFLLALLFLHGGWLVVPILLRLARLSRTDTSSFELLTEFLARQQRSTSATEVLQVTVDTLQKLPCVGGTYMQLRLSLENTQIVSSLRSNSLQEAFKQLFRQRSGTDNYQIILSSLQKENRALPDRNGILLQHRISVLRGATLYQVLQTGVFSAERDGFEERDIQLIATLVEQTVLFLENLERRSYHEQLLTARKEEDFLRETREALLPPPPPILQKVDFYVLFEQYDRTIGGDYYQVYEHAGGSYVDFWLSDSAGSGIAAAYQMAQARGVLNTLWLQPTSAESLVFQLNDALKRVFHKNNFLAATLLRFDLTQKEYTLIRAGNPEIFYWNPLTEQVEVLRPSGIVLGSTSSQIISRILVPEKGRLLPGSLFMLFSDGFTEATSPEGEMFGTERLLSLFSTYHKLPTEDLAHRILEAVQEFTGGGSLGDDGTLMLIRYTG